MKYELINTLTKIRLLNIKQYTVRYPNTIVYQTY